MIRDSRTELRKPGRVLHILGTAEPGGAAVARMVSDLGQALDPAKYQIQACFLHPGPLVEQFHRLGLAATCVNWNGSPTDVAGAIRCAVLLRSGDFAIIHQHLGGRFLTAMERTLTRASLVHSLHGRASEVTGQISHEPRLPGCDALIANSKAVADFSNNPAAVVIYPGVDATLFHLERRAHHGIVIGTVCRLEKIKGLIYLLNAIAALTPEFPDLRLEIAGDGSLRAFLEDETHRLQISHRVSFLGWREDVPSVMAGWDIFVLPSLDEGFGFAALEAMAAGLPVVASAVGGLCELVQNGETGWLVPAAAPSEIAKRVRDLILDPRLRETMGTAGRERASRQFSVLQMIDKIVAVYDELISRNGPEASPQR